MLELLLQNVSYLGIIAILVMTGCGLPIPEEIPVVVAGWAAATGRLDTLWAFLACVVGAVGGDCLMYAIGHRFGHGLVREHPLLARFFRPEREQAVERMIQRHGLKVLFLGRFLVGLRSTIYLAAGVMRVPFRWFLLFDVLCASAVIAVFFGLAYRFATQIDNVLDWIRGAELTLTGAVVLAVVVVVGIYIVRRRRRIARVRERRLARGRLLSLSSARVTASTASTPADATVRGAPPGDSPPRDIVSTSAAVATATACTATREGAAVTGSSRPPIADEAAAPEDPATLVK